MNNIPRNFDSILNRKPNSSNTTPSIRLRSTAIPPTATTSTTTNTAASRTAKIQVNQATPHQNDINLCIENFKPKGSPSLSVLLEIGIRASHWNDRSTSPLISPILSSPQSPFLTLDGREGWDEYFSSSFQSPISECPLNPREERLFITGQYSYPQYHNIRSNTNYQNPNTNPNHPNTNTQKSNTKKFVSKLNTNSSFKNGATNSSDFESQFDSRNDDTFGDFSTIGGGGGSSSSEMSFGSFDSKGSFNIPGQRGMKPFVKLTLLDFQNTESTVSVATTTSPNVVNIKKETFIRSHNTMWFYRDPHGQIQGPFSDDQMMNWYEKDYFPDSLPLRRAQDSVYYSLSVWKSRSSPPSKSPFHPDSEIGNWSLSEEIQEFLPTVAKNIKEVSTFTVKEVHTSTVKEVPAFTVKEVPAFTVKTENPAAKTLGMDQLEFLGKFKKEKQQEKQHEKQQEREQEKQQEREPVNNVQKLFEQFKIEEKEKPQVPNISNNTNAWKSASSANTIKKPIDFATLLHQEEEVVMSKKGENLERKQKTHSFADLMKQADANIVSPIQQVSQQPQAPIVEDTLRKWCLQEMKPLSSAVDINLCSTLLMSMSSRQEIISFLEDNLRIPSKRCGFDLDLFGIQFYSKKSMDSSKGGNGGGGGGPSIKLLGDGFQTSKRR